MPRSREAEMAQQRQSPRAPPRLKTTAGHGSDGRSPRSPLNEKKKQGSRVAELEAKLGEAQEELKSLREQLATVQQELEEAKKRIPIVVDDPQHDEQEMSDPDASHEESVVTHHGPSPIEESSMVTDVFEVVPMPMDPLDGEGEDEEKRNPEVSVLRSELFESLTAENERLKKEMMEVMESAGSKEAELGMKVASMGEELTESRATAERLREQLEAVEGAKAVMEGEMKRMRVQSDQWSKAAEAAVAALYGGGGVVGSPLMDGELGGGKKGGGIRVFGDLWKKKGQHK